MAGLTLPSDRQRGARVPGVGEQWLGAFVRRAGWGRAVPPEREDIGKPRPQATQPWLFGGWIRPAPQVAPRGELLPLLAFRAIAG